MIKKVIQSHKAPGSRSMGPHVRQVIPSAVGDFDPFVFLDHFGPFVKTPEMSGVPPHPHAGIATITYLLEGDNRHQDSYGHDAHIQAGDLAWMRAGKGIIHAEGMKENRTAEERIHGLQFWISLPAKDKFIEPDFFHYPSDVMPTIKLQGATIKVLCGTLLDRQSLVESLSPAYIFDVQLQAGGQVDIPVTSGNSCGVYVVEGELMIGDQSFGPQVMIRMDENGDVLQVASNAGSRFVVLGGEPLREPIVAYASFVMNSHEQIQQVVNDYHAGKMGELIIE